VLRDILYVSTQLESNRLVNLTSSTHISNVVFAILRNAKAILPGADPNLVVCWGGHSINEVEYQYTRAVGSELGLRELNICTGCGPGAMEGPMKGPPSATPSSGCATAVTSVSPSLPSSPPNRRTPSSTSW
jgi:predicted Rossmann-fold nucleotide-binding protein